MSGWDGTGTLADPHRLKFDGTDDFVDVANEIAKSFKSFFPTHFLFKTLNLNEN
jgi:hypothetical protein